MRTAFALGMLATASGLQAGFAHAQARGPSYEQIREEGLHITGRREVRELALQETREQAEQERIALLDPAERARRFAELDAILRRLPGRFRIDGGIEMQGRPGVTVRRDVSGIADCSSVGDGVGLNCIINASWPIVEPIPPGPVRGGPPPVSEQLGTMRPAVLVIGRNIDPPGIRAMMVTADTVASNWVGELRGDGAAKLARPSRCWSDARCYHSFEVVTGPDTSNLSFVLRVRNYTITLALHPDSQAEPANPLKAR